MSDNTPAAPTPTNVATFAQGNAVASLRTALNDPTLVEMDDLDPAQMALLTLAQLEAAPDLESAFGKQESTGASDIIGRPLVLDGLALRKSTLDDGAGVFMIVRSTDAADGGVVVWTTGSAKIMGQLALALDAGAIPGLAVRVIELGAAKKKGQNAPLGLELVK